MFKHYLTYNFALSFHRACSRVEAPAPVLARVMRSSEQMTHHFNLALRARDPKDQARHFFASLQNLRDCREALDESKIRLVEVETPYAVLHPRLEQLLAQVADRAENGQLRMLG